MLSTPLDYDRYIHKLVDKFKLDFREHEKSKPKRDESFFTSQDRADLLKRMYAENYGRDFAEPCVLPAKPDPRLITSEMKCTPEQQNSFMKYLFGQDYGKDKSAPSNGYFRARDFQQIWEATPKVCRSKNFSENYIIQKNLASGGFGSVFLSRRIADNKLVAMKHVELNKIHRWGKINPEITVPMEAYCMHKLQNVKGAVQLFDVYKAVKDPEDGYLMVMEFPENSVDLWDYITSKNHMDQDEAKMVFKQLVEIFLRIQNAGIVHRDIKDENMLIDKTTKKIVVIDFGSGALVQSAKFRDFTGTRVYCPPEFIRDQGYEGESSTVWMLGIVLFNMVAGDVPFQDKDNILSGKLKFPFILRNPLKHMIISCLNQNPTHRPTLEEILDHPWLKPSRLKNTDSMASLVAFEKQRIEKKIAAGLATMKIETSPTDKSAAKKKPSASFGPLSKQATQMAHVHTTVNELKRAEMRRIGHWGGPEDVVNFTNSPLGRKESARSDVQLSSGKVREVRNSSSEDIDMVDLTKP